MKDAALTTQQIKDKISKGLNTDLILPLLKSMLSVSGRR